MCQERARAHMIVQVCLRSPHNTLRLALLVMLVAVLPSDGGCVDSSNLKVHTNDPPSYKISDDQDFSRQARYTMRGSSGEVVTGSYEENPRVVLTGTDSKKKPLTYFDTTWKSSLGQGLAESKVEFANSSFNPYPDGQFDSQNSSNLFRYNLSSAGQEFRYGLQYYSTGKGFATPGKDKKKVTADREGTEFWGQWRMGALSLKPLFSHSYDNLNVDPDRPRLTDNQVGLRLDHSLMSWPYLGYSVSYMQGTRQSSLEPENYAPVSGPISTATLSVDYSDNTWSASLYSSRSKSENSESSNVYQNTTVGHYLSGSYYPNKIFSISGSLDQMRDEYGQWDATTLTRDASLSLSYRPTVGNFDRYAYVSYSAQKNAEWKQDYKYLSTGLGQRWYLLRKPSMVSAVSFDVSYNQYLDDVYSEASTRDLAVWLRYNFTLGAKPLLASRLAYLMTPPSGGSVPVVTRRATVNVPQVAEDGQSENLGTTTPTIEAGEHPAPSVAARDASDEPGASSPDLGVSADWLGAQDGGQYTIQLLSSRQEQDATEFIRRHQLNGRAEYAAIEQDGVTSYKVLYGVYPDLATATAAAKALPASLQESGPWARKIEALQAYLVPTLKTTNHPAPSVAARKASDEPGASSSDLPASADWLGAQDGGRYTIQLLSSRLEQDAMDFIRRNQLNEKAEYAAIKQNGVTSYKVLYGVYPDLATATAAANALPASLQESGPWARKIDALQASRVPTLKTTNHPAPSVAARKASNEPRASSSDLPESADWLGTQDAGQFTIQLSSSRQEQSARDFIRHHQLNEKAEYAAIEEGGVTSYKVFYGVYPDLATATAAANSLPPSLQQSSPWVRKISVLRAARK
jgi:septal ring-binding cell division protein DamX